MNRLLRPILVSVSFVGLLAIVYANMAPPPPTTRAEMWNAVKDAENKGLPQTAIKAVEPIIESAIKAKAFPEAIKAIAKRATLQAQIEGAKPEETATRLKAEIAKAPPEMVPVLNSLLAHWYWNYFQQNRWRFQQRSATSAPAGDDILTWDLKRIYAEIDAQYTKALSAEKELKAIPIATYNDLIPPATMPDAYRPTLYDFIAFDALQFYTSGEQAGAKASDAFEIDAGGPVLGTTQEFLTWKPITTDADSPKLKAIMIFQSLLNFHADDKDRSAYLDAELARLQFGGNVSYGEQKTPRYKATLKTFADAHADHELSSMARHRLATIVFTENDRVEARTIAMQGMNAYPKSHGAQLCAILIHTIESASVSVATERVWNDPAPPLRVTYRNLTKVYFRALKVEWTQRLTRDRFRPEYLSQADREQFAKRKPDLEWTAEVPATPDYRDHIEDTPSPKGLKPGYYFILASRNAEFTDNENELAVTDIWVSDLAIVTRNEWGKGILGGLVLDAKTGTPLPGALVRTFKRNPKNNTIEPSIQAKTDTSGLYKIAGVPQGQYFVLVSHEGQELGANSETNIYVQPDQYRPAAQTILFTDRSLYRPGQTVMFKGITLMADQKADNYRVLPGRKLTVIFQDPNGKEISRMAVVSNDFGSFTGNFTAPRDRLAGQMFLRVEQDGGGTGVSVEEYKRPKFQTTLEAPKAGIKLGGEITLTGKAIGYSGAAVSNAKIRYRVNRAVQYPSWFLWFYSWRMPPNFGEAQEIAFGTATTEADGTFTVKFTAKPDLSVPEKDDPRFQYTVTADVTDTTGETRSASETVTIGYTALDVTLSAEAWQVVGTDVVLTVNTRTLNGEPLGAKGTVKIYRLKAPATVQRSDILGSRPMPRRGRGQPVNTAITPIPDLSNPNNWELGEEVATAEFTTDATGKQELKFPLGAGIYRAVLSSADSFGKPVSALTQIQVVKPDDAKCALPIANIFNGPKWSLEPGEEFRATWGTGYPTGRAYVEIEHRGNLLQAYWTDAAKTQQTVVQPITEAMRGGFTVRVSYVRENRAYLESRHVDVPWTNKDLSVKWERFVSKLEPAKKETFTAIISGPKASLAVAEMVAALYDSSLDAFLPHYWMQKFNVFRQDSSSLGSSFENMARQLNVYRGNIAGHGISLNMSYRAYPGDLVHIHRLYFRKDAMMRGGMPAQMSAAAPGMVMESAAKSADAAADGAFAFGGAGGGLGGGAAPVPEGPDLNKVTARKNLNETAFFFPQLTTTADGKVKMEFTMPEALTKWKFLGFAHDKELKSGFLDGEVVTAKDLMVQPNPPRFLREGDILEFSVKVSNQSPTKQTGKVRLTLNDARTNAAIDAAMGNTATEQAFEIPPGESRSFAWKLTVPDGQGPIIYKAVGASDRVSDGEEGMLPVLSKRILVTESIPLPIRGKSTKTFDFTKLLDAGKSDTLKTQSLTVQMTSQPAWYAVLALPYLMEYPHECSEQTFNRLYANALAQHVANSDPKIRRVFDLWKNTPALDSPLSKNQDLKSVMVEETPWLRDSDKESAARRNVGVLFDANRLADETTRNLQKLAEMQRDDGTWPWFPGGPKNEYLTLYITTGFGRMRHLGVKIDTAAAIKSLTALDAWMDEQHKWILKHSKNPEENHFGTTIAIYLYGRSFFLAEQAVGPQYQDALQYWLRQAKNHWLKVGNRQSQAHAALGLKRFGDKDTPRAIVASIKEFSVRNEELGMFWRDTEQNYWWYHAPIETQAVMIELFDEVANDADAVEECKVWLLKQKQTQNWKTTKATADAVYALLLRGSNLLKSDALTQVKLGEMPIVPEAVEAGTGFYEQKLVRGEVKPAMGKITVTKPDDGVSWGSVHWQYLEDVSKISAHEGTPLKLEKKLFKRTLTKAGPVLDAINGPIAVGDEVVCRVVLRTDRDMEYVHLKDQRGSGTEPVNVLSRYKFQDGLYYYESTKDTATHFFIDYLPKGVYVFEYTVRVQHKGQYPSGLASIQCMYAPEFNSHSESVLMDVK